jgi:hypothetical protein
MVNPNRFYTYAYLREDKTPYYIGKGTKNRLYIKKKSEIKPPRDKSRIIFLKQNLTEEEAFKHEKYMIAVFGRNDLGTGILHNKTDGGDGASNKSEETKKKLREANVGENNPNYGKTGEKSHNYGKKWWNDGCGNVVRSIECPGEGWVLGMDEEMNKKKVKFGENHPAYGKKWWNDGCGNVKQSVECPGEGWVLGMDEEMNRKQSEKMKGRKWWNDGCGNNKLLIECPGEGWVLGMNGEHKIKCSVSKQGKKWWNDGCGNSVLVVECPGEGWVPGRGKLPRKLKALHL